MKYWHLSLILLAAFPTSCFLFPEPVPEDCELESRSLFAGYVVEVRHIPDLNKVRIEKVVSTFSDPAQKNLGMYQRYHDDYDSIVSFYTGIPGNESWMKRFRYIAYPKPERLGDLSVWVESGRQGSLGFLVRSKKSLCIEGADESIIAFKNRTPYLSFRLYYNGKIYDGGNLLRYEHGRMTINKNKVKVIQPTAAEKSTFYPPLYVQHPDFILAKGRYVVQFEDLREVEPQ